MIQHRSIINAADNSGATKLRVIHIYGGSRRKFGRIGDILNCVILEVGPNSQIKDGEMVKAVLVRSRKEIKRLDGSYIRFSDNAAVVLENVKDKTPKGTRIIGPIAREIKEKGFAKIASLAQEVI